ncbi:DUF3617 family protein [Rhodanobacter umsongensis]
MNHRVLLFACLLPALAIHATDAPPSPQLQKGEWKYHAVIEYGSAAMARRTVQRDWRVCTEGDKSTVPAMLPKPAKGDTTCTPPTLQSTDKSFHTTMTCTTLAQGMNSKVSQDIVFTPGDAGRSVAIHGKVHQELSGLPVAVPPVDMSIQTTGKLVGQCKGH